MIVTRDFLVPLISHFKDPKIFAVAPRLFYWDKSTFHSGVNMGTMREGYIEIWNEANTSNTYRIETPFPTIYACGGAMIFDKNKYMVLGGMDSIFHPFCWEDIDVSYRALKMNWKIIYEPKALCITRQEEH